MKSAASILTVALAMLVLAGGASAQKPERTVLTADDEFSLAGFCDFTVLLEIEGTIIETKFRDKEGDVVREAEVYPAYKTTLTNEETGESIVVVHPGPEFIRYSTAGSQTRIGTGPWLFGDNPETGETGLFLVRGRWVETAAGTTFVGNVVDLCAELTRG